MCGRYVAAKDPAKLAAEFDAIDATGDGDFRVDYNVAPTKKVVAVVQRHPVDAEGEVDEGTTERTLRMMKWGFLPVWAKDPAMGSRMINTRSESAAEKPAFKSSLAKRRCILPADGWYEWRREGKLKQPFYTAAPDGSSLAMAGLWSTWRDKSDPDAPVLVTCSVLTTEAVGQVAEVHDRMPLLLTPDDWARWLDPDNADVSALLAPPAAELVATLEMRPVSPSVNNVRNNGPDLLAPFDPAADLDDPALFSADSPAGTKR